jgi:predicted HTH transcriptional regulator
MNFEFDLTQKGHLKKRESFDLEYKENFQLGDNLVKYIKTLAGMANNKGGIILFGVKDSPHIPLGMQNNKFTEIDPRKIDKEIREYFSPELIWETYIQIFDNKSFGTALRHVPQGMSKLDKIGFPIRF